MEIHLREVMATTRRMAEIIAFHSGQSIEKVEHDIDRDYFMTAEEARAYGIVDDTSRRRAGSAPPPAGLPGSNLLRRSPVPAERRARWVQCARCVDVIVSAHAWDSVTCRCGGVVRLRAAVAPAHRLVGGASPAG